VNSAQQFVLNKKKQIKAKQNSLFIYIPPTVLISQTKKHPVARAALIVLQFTTVFRLGQRGAYLINPPALFLGCEIGKYTGFSLALQI
jgi:hypothetical protein